MDVKGASRPPRPPGRDPCDHLGGHEVGLGAGAMPLRHEDLGLLGFYWVVLSDALSKKKNPRELTFKTGLLTFVPKIVVLVSNG